MRDRQADRQTDRWIRIITYQLPLTEALALIGCTVNVDFGADDVAEW